MSLPQALTWLHLFPGSAVMRCDDGPDWFRALLRERVGGDAPNVSVLWESKLEAEPQIKSLDGVVAINCRGVSEKKLRDAGFAYVRRFAVLPNLKNARWLVSIDSRAVASAGLCLYTPARVTARMKQIAVRLAAQSGLSFWYRDEIWIAQRQPPPLERTLAPLFPGTDIRLGLSSGAPEGALNRKASAAVLGPDGKRLAFVKIADSPVARRILQHEAEMLRALSQHEAPRLLFAGEIEGRYVTVQSPLRGVPAPARITAAHRKFLQSLRNGKRRRASDIQMVATLPSRMATLKPTQLDLHGALEEVMPVLDHLTVPATIVHGDFAPWNLRSFHGEVFAFDWEYGEVDGLPLIDEMHFLLQVGYNLESWDLSRAQRCMAALADASPMGMNAQQVRAVQVIYLLDNLARLLHEGYGEDHEMVAWYARLLATLTSKRREMAMA